MAALVGQEAVWKQCLSLLETPCHLFLTGAPGCGKSTLVKSLLHYYATKHKRPNADEWGVQTTEECLLLGPDQDRGIQTIRGYVSLFIRQKGIEDISSSEKIYRWVIVDDVDTFPQICQQALRRPMESYSHITRFLFIGTSEEDLIPALRSRCIHITMNTVDTLLYKNAFINYIGIEPEQKITDDMWNWIINIAGNNNGDLIRLLKLIKDITCTLKGELTLKTVRTLCSAPFYMDFIPLLNAMTQNNIEQSIKCLLLIWKRGYAYEDILESFQTINTLFGSNGLNSNILIHKFLINAWISYCKGNTSILALQNVVYKTLVENMKED